MNFIRFIIFIFSTFISLIYAQQPYGLTVRDSNTSLLLSTSGDTLAEMQLRRVFSDIPLSKPIYLYHANDGTNRIFVVEKSGRIKVFENDENTNQYKVFLDIRDSVNSSPSEAGLLSMAFHPKYSINGKFYVYYNFGSLNTRVSEFSVSTNPDSAASSTGRALFEIDQPYSNHNGGQIAFGPDGFLYIGLGDGGNGGDPLNSGQDTHTYLGSILRIIVDAIQPGLQYKIPEDNPFYNKPDKGLPEIWAWGLRNPWRFSFDNQTGYLWAGDVGQGTWEEVDIIEGGKNYGWRIMEGFHCYNPSSGCDTTGLTLPIVEYSHSLGKSITGGFVYRGSKLPRLSGVYLYGDYVTRKIWGLKYENGQIIDNRLIAESASSISSFGQDEMGEVYVVGYDGKIFAFEEKSGNPPPRHIPDKISESGLFSSIDSLIPAPGIIPYSVNAQLWSDGAFKDRFIALPETSKIEFKINEPWLFPPNAVLVKNFFLEFEKGNPDSREIIETRFLVRHNNDNQWEGFSYMWNDEASDGFLLDSSATKTFIIKDGDTNIEQSYYYPSKSECLVCHTPASGFVIGVKTAQNNKLHLYDSVWDNQLRSYNNIRLFAEDIGKDYADFPKLINPEDTTAGIEDRARSYLDANCANCHLPGGSGRGNLDLRFSIPLASAHLVDEPATIDDMGIADAVLLKSDHPDSSILYLRMRDLDEFRMPQLATSIVDEYGTALIAAWIDTLGVATDLNGKDSETPKVFELYPAYPNPFNPVTVISWQLPTSSEMELSVYNLIGQKVATLVSEWRPAGTHQIEWNATAFASGVYIARLSADGLTKSRKIVLLK